MQQIWTASRKSSTFANARRKRDATGNFKEMISLIWLALTVMASEGSIGIHLARNRRIFLDMKASSFIFDDFNLFLDFFNSKKALKELMAKSCRLVGSTKTAKIQTSILSFFRFKESSSRWKMSWSGTTILSVFTRKDSPRISGTLSRIRLLLSNQMRILHRFESAKFQETFLFEKNSIIVIKKYYALIKNINWVTGNLNSGQILTIFDKISRNFDQFT